MLLKRVRMSVAPFSGPYAQPMPPAVTHALEACLDTAAALVTAAPGPSVRDALQALWDTVPG